MTVVYYATDWINFLERNLHLAQYIKEYKVGHGARKIDHFARAVFVLIVRGADQ